MKATPITKKPRFRYDSSERPMVLLIASINKLNKHLPTLAL